MTRRRGRPPVAFLPYALKHQGRGQPRHGRAQAANGLMLRGVVIKTIIPNGTVAIARANERAYDPSTDPGVKCDVLVIDPEYRTILRDVPIMTESGGLNDYTEWRPRETSLSLTGEAVTISKEGDTVRVTRTHDQDGDHVIIGFLANDLNQPIIIGQVPHPRTKRKPSALAGAQYKLRRFIRGIDFGILDDGNVEIDLSAASDGSILGNGNEIASVPASGNVIVTLFTGAKISIRDSVASAPEPVLLGNQSLTDLSSFLTSLVAHLSDLSAALGETSTLFTGLFLPTPLHAASIAEIATFTAAIASLQADITTSQAAGLPFLSSHLETD